MRKHIFLCSTLLVCLAFTSIANATTQAARQKLETSVNKILAIVMDPSYPTPEKRPALNARIETEVRTIFDFHEFSMRTMGPNWKKFSSDQQNRFSEAFATLLVYTYLGKIDKYNGEKVQITGDKSDSTGQRVEVQTILTLQNGTPIPVAYRMLPKNNTWCVYDVLVEGISLVKNYRTQFHDILSKELPDQLIQRVTAKANEMRELSNDKE